jgi:HD-GYP domain-containing protein (c-di-GMP phosphodiesterase class II)
VGLTFRMLNALPYPRKLKNVPLHAGAHHERMDGRGYPFGLKRELIPMQGRMIGMADVFEALTSKDRPYKRSKTLSEALQIMQSMKEDGHIDPDLYDVFMKERIYMRYALEYLDPGQIDDLTFLEAPLPEAAEDRVV